MCVRCVCGVCEVCVCVCGVWCVCGVCEVCEVYEVCVWCVCGVCVVCVWGGVCVLCVCVCVCVYQAWLTENNAKLISALSTGERKSDLDTLEIVGFQISPCAMLQRNSLIMKKGILWWDSPMYIKSIYEKNRISQELSMRNAFNQFICKITSSDRGIHFQQIWESPVSSCAT